jgi:hypothetical protein
MTKRTVASIAGLATFIFLAFGSASGGSSYDYGALDAGDDAPDAPSVTVRD